MKRLAAFFAVWLVSVPALAQPPNWEVEVYGGGIVATSGGHGTRTLPPAGAPLVTSTPIFPTRETSSWFFGDGAVLLNGVNEAFGASGRITPLDAIFVSPGGDRSGAFGVRVHRRLNARWSAEFGVDTTAAASAPGGFAAAIEASRASFATAFTSLLATGPFNAVAIDAVASSDDGSRRETTATAALNLHWKGWGSFAPYATVGGGIAAGSGAMATADLSGRYGFIVAGDLPIAETDAVRVRFDRPPAFVLVLGGGLRRDLSGRWGLTFDARVLVGPDSTRVRVDAQPSSTRGVPGGFVESFTNPAIQFSNEPGTGRRSTLSGPALDGVAVFKGGTRARTQITVGLRRSF